MRGSWFSSTAKLTCMKHAGMAAVRALHVQLCLHPVLRVDPTEAPTNRQGSKCRILLRRECLSLRRIQFVVASSPSCLPAPSHVVVSLPEMQESPQFKCIANPYVKPISKHHIPSPGPAVLLPQPSVHERLVLYFSAPGRVGCSPALPFTPSPV